MLARNGYLLLVLVVSCRNNHVIRSIVYLSPDTIHDCDKIISIFAERETNKVIRCVM